MKKRIRKTGEVVDVITYSNPYCSERDDMDCVSYIDSKGEEHHHEKGLNLWWDFEDVEEELSIDIDWEKVRMEQYEDRYQYLKSLSIEEYDMKTTLEEQREFCEYQRKYHPDEVEYFQTHNPD